jgi:tetraacyldisaccharide-1-P 4'-kinase
MAALADRRVMVVSGIGDPERFEAQVARAARDVVGHMRRGDHAAYTADDVRSIDQEAKRVGADVIVTTEKDWAKMRKVGGSETAVPVWRAALAIQFEGDGEQQLFERILAAVQAA